MRKILQLFAAAIFCALSAGAVPVSPIQNPHVTFVNGAGLPCAGCKLSTFAAGTTTPLATYTDSTGTTQNQNPVILDAAGGAFIWVGSNSYKFILEDALGNTIWSVDNVNAGNLFPCGAAGAVQISSGSSGLSCDANITINTTSHTLSIGTLGANYVTIGALGTPTTWTFDTTSPATARASLGVGTTNPGTINQLGYYAAAGSTLSGTSAIPDGITATTQAPNDNSSNPATTAYVAHPGSIAPTDLAVGAGTPMTGNRGDGVLVQHSTGSVTSGNCAKFDAAGNTVDSGAPCQSTQNDYYFSFTGCTLAVSGNSTNCRGTAAFSGVTPSVPVQPDTNYYIGCTAYTTQPWGSSTGVNNVSTSSFDYAENVDRYNGVSATVTPTVYCHLHHN